MCVILAHNNFNALIETFKFRSIYLNLKNMESTFVFSIDQPDYSYVTHMCTARNA